MVHRWEAMGGISSDADRHRLQDAALALGHRVGRSLLRFHLIFFPTDSYILLWLKTPTTMRCGLPWKRKVGPLPTIPTWFRRVRNLRIDLGAERLIAAEKAGETIAVEVKSFVGISSLHEFYKAVGQFDYYKFSLAKQDAERILFLAVPFDFFEEFVEEDVHNQAYIADRHIRIIVYNPDTATLLKWIK